VGWVAWLGASPLLGIALVPLLMRSVGPQPGRAAAGANRAGVRAALVPSLVLFAVTLAGGGVVTFLPIERPDGVLATTALLLFGATGAVTRWQAGMLADRLGVRLLLPLAVALASLGLVGVGAGLATGEAWVLVGAAVFGMGFGAVQNLTLLSAFTRAGESGTTAASAMWNAAFDAGTATGALALGLVAAGIGLDRTYVVVAAALAAMLPLAAAAARPARAVSPGRARRRAATG